MSNETFVYICRDGENEELRYSIRSVLHFFPDANIWVIGGKPDWYAGNFIRVWTKGGKYYNARRNLTTLVNSQEIPEKFILMNDDFFIVKPIKNIGYYNNGLLDEKIDKYYTVNPNSSYLRMLETTATGLKRLGFPNPVDYELHIPMPMQKSKLAKVISYPYLWRSTYGNLYNVGGRARKDVKIYKSEKDLRRLGREDFKTSAFLSTEDDSFEYLLNKLLIHMFPLPTYCEKV